MRSDFSPYPIVMAAFGEKYKNGDDMESYWIFCWHESASAEDMQKIAQRVRFWKPNYATPHTNPTFSSYVQSR
jgi:hypothetical protein